MSCNLVGSLFGIPPVGLEDNIAESSDGIPTARKYDRLVARLALTGFLVRLAILG
jgi:hypothetical protein